MAQKRISMDIDRPDFVTATKQYAETKRGIQGKEWDINLMIMVFASSETLASALTAIFRELVQNPGVLQRLTTEIRSTFDIEEEIDAGSTHQLPYLNAVMNEGLRLDPPSVMSPPRVAPPGGDVICNRFVPEGTYVAYNQFSGNRQEYNFHFPNTFLPERFLPLCRDNKDDMACFQPFGTGRHQCIGLKLAYAEMRLVVARVVFSFDLRLADERDKFDWGEQFTYITWEKRPLNVKMSEAVR